MNLYKEALSAQKELKSRISSLERELKSCPPGSLRCHKHGAKYRYYQFFPDPKNPKNGIRHHISSKNLDLARDLARKAYILYQLHDLQNELKAVESYLKNHKNPRTEDLSILMRNEGFRKLLLPSFYSLTDELEEWKNAQYDRLEEYPESLNVQTITGDYVRSKSESMIYSMLVQKGIPFRYECKLILDSITIYPDFTIRHPRSGMFVIWEHFGLSDNSEYQSNMLSKHSIYLRNGYIPGYNLILTYETKDHPLSYHLINDITDHYFG